MGFLRRALGGFWNWWRRDCLPVSLIALLVSINYQLTVEHRWSLGETTYKSFGTAVGRALSDIEDNLDAYSLVRGDEGVADLLKTREGCGDVQVALERLRERVEHLERQLP